jgi:uncharacterized protein (TIGR02452 family)
MPNKIPKWNASDWLVQFQSTYDIYSLLSEVYENTVAICKTKSYISSSGLQVELNLNPNIIQDSILYDTELPQLPTASSFNTKISVVANDCLVEAKKLADQGLEVCVLNMADSVDPGGLVIEGERTQEEYLFRCSDYFRSLYHFDKSRASRFGIPLSSHKRYPLDPLFGAVFTRHATVFRGPEEEGYPLLDSPWKVNFIAVAAINCPETILVNGEIQLTEEETEITKTKLRTLFRVLKANQQTNLILSALGCGAFGNPPSHMARLFKEILAEDEFSHAFQTIIFSIKADSPYDHNYTAFSEVFY